MGAKFVATATFNKEEEKQYNSENKYLSYDYCGNGGWIFKYMSADSCESTATSGKEVSSNVSSVDQFTVGTVLPSGDTMKDKLDSWAKDEVEIMKYPMPIGGMTLVPLVDEIWRSKEVRNTLDDWDAYKLGIIREHIAKDKYCQHLINLGKMTSCEDPKEPEPVVPPPSFDFKDKNYVYYLTDFKLVMSDTDPYKTWDFSGSHSMNGRYCKGLVAAARGYFKKNKYN